MFPTLTMAEIYAEEHARILREFNGCHDGDGRFCGGGAGRWAVRSATTVRRTARRLNRKLKTQLASTKADPARAARHASLHKRMAVVRPIVDRAKATSLWGTMFGQPWAHKPWRLAAKAGR